MTEVINVKILHLVLKKKWYEMQESGEKTEEYRELTEYWRKRLIDQETLRAKPYTHVCFHYGYTQRCFINRIDSITIGMGLPEWGAPEYREVFIIKHHKEPSPDYIKTVSAMVQKRMEPKIKKEFKEFEKQFKK